MQPPRGPSGWPFIGNLLECRSDPLAFFTRCFEFGEVVSVRLAHLPTVIVSSPGLILETLARSDLRKDFLLRDLSPVIGNGLLTLPHSEWAPHRRAFSPSFTPMHVDLLGPEIQALIQTAVSLWPVNVEVDLLPLALNATRDVIGNVLFGSVFSATSEVNDRLRDLLDAYSARFDALIPWPRWIPTPMNVRERRASRSISRLVAELVALAAPHSALGRVRDSRAISGAALLDEATTLFLAGHETTALLVTYALAAVSALPAAERERVGQDEEWRRAVIRETLRLYPPAWALGREPVERNTTIGGFEIARGTQILLPQWVVHRRKDLFGDDAGSFRPSRWLEGLNAALAASRTLDGRYFPFGSGERSCIGEHLAVFEANYLLQLVLESFDIEHTGGDIEAFEPSVTLRPKSPLTVRLVPRRAVPPT